jgi:hypothetical protein
MFLDKSYRSMGGRSIQIHTFYPPKFPKNKGKNYHILPDPRWLPE